MMNATNPFFRALLVFSKIVGSFIQWLRLGAGGTWPGEIALQLNPTILQELFPKIRKGIIIVAGTNGKTTTSLMIKKILEENGEKVIHNGSGANLVNGVVSAFIQEASWTGEINADYGVFEVDENSLPQIASSVKRQASSKKQKLAIVLLNLFRDQLDRYGEVDVIAEKWEKALSTLDTGNQAIKPYHSFVPDTGNQRIKRDQISYILNADDPLIAHIAKKSKLPTRYFGLNDPKAYLPKMEHATDSIFCLNCGGRLTYQGLYYSHIGIWHCEQCGEKRPDPDISSWNYPLPGLYNRYNTLAAVGVAKALRVPDSLIKKALTGFAPAFGRQEEFTIDGKKVRIFLSKNPAGFNEALRTVIGLGAKNFLFVLNDRIPDGRDVSWIWDVDFEMLPKTSRVTVSGDRALDMALRLKYAEIKAAVKPLEEAVRGATWILPTYSAMLEVRKILTGKKIL